MDGPITAEIDTRKFNARIIELREALIGAGQGGDAATIFEDEARRFLQSVIRLTPPKNKAQGEARISKDLMKIFTPVNDEMLNIIGSEHGVSNIDVWITTASGDRRELDWRRIDPTGSGMRQFHNANRDSRGRTKNLKRQFGNKWYAPYVVSFQDFNDYRKRMFSHVGRRKAAWAKSFIGLGGKVSQWIGQHIAGAAGEFHNSMNLAQPSIVMINRSRGIGRDILIVRSAVRARSQAIARRLRLVLSGYNQDVAQGIKLRRQARKSGDTLQEAV